MTDIETAAARIVVTVTQGNSRSGPMPLTEAIPKDDPERIGALAEMIDLFEGGETQADYGETTNPRVIHLVAGSGA